MYYKIENTECKVYKELFSMRQEEREIEKLNREAIEQRVQLEFKAYLGTSGQLNFRRVTQYDGFEFIDKGRVDRVIWIESKDYPGVFVPNRRTKLGRDMNSFLLNGLKGSMYDKPLEILNLPQIPQFTFPFVEIVGEVIIVMLDDRWEPSDPNVVEITRKEFEAIRSEITKSVLEN
jgi:hypothetical protein